MVLDITILLIFLWQYVRFQDTAMAYWWCTMEARWSIIYAATCGGIMLKDGTKKETNKLRRSGFCVSCAHTLPRSTSCCFSCLHSPRMSGVWCWSQSYHWNTPLRSPGCSHHSGGWSKVQKCRASLFRHCKPLSEGQLLLWGEKRKKIE